MNKEVRKGLVNHEVNSSFFNFLTAECIIFACLVTYFLVEWFNFNLFATFLITLVVTLILPVTPVYSVLGVFLSLGWAYLALRLVLWLVTLSGGGNFIAWLAGIIVFVFIFLATFGMRIGGKEYVNDIS